MRDVPRDITDHVRARIQNRVLEFWGVRGQPITVEGVRYSKIYHPTEVVFTIQMELEESGYTIPAKLDGWVNARKWAKKEIRYGLVDVPHLQAKRKWGKGIQDDIYTGRRGFIGLERGGAYVLANQYFKEVLAAQ